MVTGRPLSQTSRGVTGSRIQLEFAQKVHQM